MISYFVYLVIFYIVMVIGEYWIHKMLMHKPVLARSKWFSWIFTDHAIEHHKNERLDMNIDMPIHHHLIAGSPLLLGSFFLGWSAIAALLTIFIWHSYFWTKLHRAIHGLEDNWIGRSWFYPAFRDQHINHHKNPTTNYGVTALWTDRLFGTVYREPPYFRKRTPYTGGEYIETI